MSLTVKPGAVPDPGALHDLPVAKNVAPPAQALPPKGGALLVNGQVRQGQGRQSALLSSYLEQRSTHSSTLNAALEAGNVDAIKELLQQELNHDWRTPEGETLLHVAVRKGDVETATLLREKGDPNLGRTLDGATPLHLAAEENDPEMMKMLLRP